MLTCSLYSLISASKEATSLLILPFVLQFKQAGKLDGSKDYSTPAEVTHTKICAQLRQILAKQ